MGLITIPYLKSLSLPVKTTQWPDDEVLQTLIDEASQHIEDYTDRKFASATYTERIVGRDRYTLQVEEYPIISLNSMTARDIYDNVESFSTSGFLVHSEAGLIEWLNKASNMFLSNRIYVVNYTAGYLNIPGPVKRAVALQVIKDMQPNFRQSATMQPVDFVSSIDEDIVEKVEKYRRKRIG